MSLDENAAATIGAIYDAAMAPALWDQALDRLAALFRPTSTVCLAMERFGSSAPDATYWCGSSIEREMQDYYRRELAFNSDKATMYLYYPRFPLVSPFLRTSMETDEDFIAADSYELWNRPMNMFYFVSSKVFATEDEIALLHLGRKRSDGDFGAEDVARLAVLAPHVRRAVQMQRRLALAEAAHASLDGLAWAIAFVDAEGRLLSCNAAAEALLAAGDGLALRRGRLVAVAPRETGALRAAIRQAALAVAGAAAPPAVLALPRPSLKRALEVLVAPLRGEAARPGQPPTVAVFVSDPERRAKPAAEVLRGLYGLSRAEAALAAALVEGHGLGAAADRLGISQATAKTQLQAVFAKTDTSRQAQLVHLLLRGPAMLAPPR